MPDLGHSAIQVFSRDGELERFVRLAGEGTPLAEILAYREQIRSDPLSDGLIAQGAGGVLVAMRNRMSRRMGQPENEAPPGVDDRALETLDLSGNVIVSTPILQGWRAPRTEVTTEDRYFEPGFHWDLLPDGTIAYSDSSGYAIKLASSDGSVTDVLTRPLSPQAVSGRVRQATFASRLERLEEQLARGPSSAGPLPPRDPEERRRRIRDRAFYHEIPVVRGVRATWDGGLWIQRRGEDPLDDAGPIDVFNAGHEYVGTLPAGAPGMPVAFGPDGLAVHLERDELDVLTVVVSRVVVDGR